MPTRASPPRAGHPTSGLTLVELLVALAIMALLALLSWRTLDGMARTQTHTRELSDAWQVWHLGLAQWGTDLDAVQDTAVLPPLEFDGQTLRLVRRAPPGQPVALQVVAWTLRPARNGPSPMWYRWASPPVTQRNDLQQAWQQAAQWSLGSAAPAGQWTPVFPLSEWHLYFHREGHWSHPLSAQDTTNAPSTPRIPDGIRVVLHPPANATSGPAGAITRDWLRPTLAGGKAG